MQRDQLNWTVEEACRNAWPSPRQLLLDGWSLRASGGPTRRTNSVNPLRNASHDPTPIVPASEAIYRSLGQRSIFRVPSIAAAMEAPLDRQGYSAEAETCTLFADFSARVLRPQPDVDLAPDTGAGWLADRLALSSPAPEAARIYTAMTEHIVLPKSFASLSADGRRVALAYGVVDRRLLVVESVVTNPDYRRRGLAAKLVGGLMAWAESRGARGACLQVEADNTAGLALYARLGFDLELYRYHYRCKVVAA